MSGAYYINISFYTFNLNIILSLERSIAPKNFSAVSIYDVLSKNIFIYFFKIHILYINYKLKFSHCNKKILYYLLSENVKEILNKIFKQLVFDNDIYISK
jgi:hypothetical protein